MVEAGSPDVWTKRSRGIPPDTLDLLPQAFNRRDAESRERQASAPAGWRDGLRRFDRWLRACLSEESEYGHLFYWAPVAMGAGAVFWFSARQSPSTLYIGLIFLLTGALALAWRYRKPGAALICTALALLCLGALSAAWETERAGTVILDVPVTTTVTATVTGREAVAGGRWRYAVDIIDTTKPSLKRMPKRATLTAPGASSPVALGATIRGRARLLPPSGPALVGLNDFAFDAYFAASGAIGYFYGRPQEIESAVVPRSAYQTVRLGLEGLRGAISARIRSVLPGDTGAFAASMVTDDRRAISRETTEALRLAGLSHVVAISGLNMALAAGLFFVGIRALLSLSQDIAHRYPVKKIAALGALLSVTGYYLISGFAVSAERAYIMMAIMLLAAVFGRPSISLRNVAFSALAILALSPSAVMGPGFQMSFAATLALVAGYSLWQGRKGGQDLERRGGFWLLSVTGTFAAGVFVTSLIGGLSTALFSIQHFHRIAVWGLPANLLAMPVISLIVMPAGLAALILMPIGLDWVPLKIMGIGLDLVIMIAKWTASLGGDVVAGRMHGWLFVGLSLCLVMLGIMRSRLRFAGLAGALVLLGAGGVVPGVDKPDLVIHEDGQLAGLVRGDRISTTSARPASFIFEQWQRALPVMRHVKPIMDASAKRERGALDSKAIRTESAALADDMRNIPTGRFRCREGRWCIARAWNGSKIVVVEIRELIGAACDRADLVVTSARTTVTACRSGAQLLSADQLRRSGTVEIWLDPENNRQFRIISGLGRGDRPWYVHRTYDWRTGQYVRMGGQTDD